MYNPAGVSIPSKPTMHIAYSPPVLQQNIQFLPHFRSFLFFGSPYFDHDEVHLHASCITRTGRPWNPDLFSRELYTWAFLNIADSHFLSCSKTAISLLECWLLLTGTNPHLLTITTNRRTGRPVRPTWPIAFTLCLLLLLLFILSQLFHRLLCYSEQKVKTVNIHEKSDWPLKSSIYIWSYSLLHINRAKIYL